MRNLTASFVLLSSLLLFGCDDNNKIIKDLSEEISDNKSNTIDLSTTDGIAEGVDVTDMSSINNIIKPQVSHLRAYNEYNEIWDVYYEKDYSNFILKTPQESFYLAGGNGNRELYKVKFGDNLIKVKSVLGEPLKQIQKGNSLFDISAENNLTYNIDRKYVTFFFDKHKNNTLRSILIIPKHTELKKDGFYGKSTNVLLQGLEDLMVELINESRVTNGLNALIYDKKVNEVARLHSDDMINKRFFDHTGSDGSSARDRMEKHGYKELMYGENIAYGQYSSIHAHEELMNSLGHRENILNKDFTHVGVGITTDSNNVPFYTINFYKK